MSGCFCVGPPGNCPCMRRIGPGEINFYPLDNKELKDVMREVRRLMGKDNFKKPHLVGPKGVIREVQS